MSAAGRLWSERLRFDARVTVGICVVLALVPIVVTGTYALGIVLVAVLLFRPQGLLGEKGREL